MKWLEFQLSDLKTATMKRAHMQCENLFRIQTIVRLLCFDRSVSPSEIKLCIYLLFSGGAYALAYLVSTRKCVTGALRGSCE